MSTTDRYDIYAPIHKALRQFMTDTLQRLGRLDLDDPQDLLLGLALLLALLDAAGHHVQHENAFIHPAIEAHSRGASARIVADHQEHLDAIAALRRNIYLEEELLFPPLREAGMLGPVMVMLLEHGQMWHLMDELEPIRREDPADPRIGSLRRDLVAQIEAHNPKE